MRNATTIATPRPELRGELDAARILPRLEKSTTTWSTFNKPAKAAQAQVRYCSEPKAIHKSAPGVAGVRVLI